MSSSLDLSSFKPIGPTCVARDQDKSLKAWPQHGLPATQLGPDDKGRNW